MDANVTEIKAKMYLAMPVAAVSARTEEMPKARPATPHMNQNGEYRRIFLARARQFMMLMCHRISLFM
jgi:hypothetical protein